MQGSREPCISFLYYAASIGIETLCIGFLCLQKLFFYRVPVHPHLQCGCFEYQHLQCAYIIQLNLHRSLKLLLVYSFKLPPPAGTPSYPRGRVVPFVFEDEEAQNISRIKIYLSIRICNADALSISIYNALI